MSGVRQAVKEKLQEAHLLPQQGRTHLTQNTPAVNIAEDGKLHERSDVVSQHQDNAVGVDVGGHPGTRNEPGFAAPVVPGFVANKQGEGEWEGPKVPPISSRFGGTADTPSTDTEKLPDEPRLV